MSEFWATFGVDLHLEVDPASGRRTGLEQALRSAIRAGRLAPRTRLPSTRSFAAELGLARGTVSAAYDQLVAEGYLVARRGSGTEVAELIDQAPEIPEPDPFAVPPRYDLRPGKPDVAGFPTAVWLRAARRALNAAQFDAYDYGDPRGRIELRTALTDYLGRARGVQTKPEHIVITSGYVQALALLVRVLGCDFAIEDPGLAFHREVVRFAGGTVLPLPVDELGAVPDRLSGKAFRSVGAAVLTPAHQYPTGVTLHPARRHAFVEWARAGGGLVVEDDYDGEFRYDRQPVGAVQGTAHDQVAYVGTAAKTLAPGVRLAWMVLPPHLVEPVVEAKRYSDYQTETIGQLTLADLITSHAYDRHIRAARLRYRRRRDLLLERIAANPPARGGFTVHGIAAGLHTRISLPAGGPDEAEVLERASAQGLAFDVLGDHWHDAGDHPQGVIVGYGTPRDRVYSASLDILLRVLRGLGRR